MIIIRTYSVSVLGLRSEGGFVLSHRSLKYVECSRKMPGSFARASGVIRWMQSSSMSSVPPDAALSVFKTEVASASDEWGLQNARFS